MEMAEERMWPTTGREMNFKVSHVAPPVAEGEKPSAESELAREIAVWGYFLGFVAVVQLPSASGSTIPIFPLFTFLAFQGGVRDPQAFLMAAIEAPRCFTPCSRSSLG